MLRHRNSAGLPFTSINLEYLKSFALNSIKFSAKIARDTLFLRTFEEPEDDKVLFDMSQKGAELEWGTGCDQDIGGYSKVNVESTPEKNLKWSGNISLALDPNSDAMYTGYAALRTRNRLPAHIFDDRCFDCSRWSFLVLRMRGDHRTYQFNFKPHRSFSGDLYSAPFKFLTPYAWEDVIFPFQWFRRTNCGVQYYRQYAPNLEKIGSFGFLLSDHIPGPFSVEIESISVTNFNFRYGHYSEWPEEDLKFLTKHLLEKKPREDYTDSIDNQLGFGFDVEGNIDSFEKQSKRYKNMLPNKVHNPHWHVEIKATSSPMRSTPSQNGRRSVTANEIYKQ